MNTKPIPAVLALIAGFVTCIMSFVQGIDVVVFAKRFVFVCLIFYVIGTVICVVINMNFKEMAKRMSRMRVPQKMKAKMKMSRMRVPQKMKAKMKMSRMIM